MGRLVWVAVGAAGGVLAYRKAQQVLEEARERGVVASLQAASGSAAGIAQGARALVGRAVSPQAIDETRPVSTSRPSGTAAARALAQSRRGSSPSTSDAERMS